ncbi:MAG TPA: glucosamine-6-phosphate deaminase [Clostridia bacterium]|nr:glucosamine-6-phosphate deaminase [Clostridia bacterium]
MKLILSKDYHDMSRKAASVISAQVILKENSVLGLATGSTPIGAYKQLIEWYKKGDVSFKSAITVNLDEYCGLPVNHEQSYFHFMKAKLFDHIDLDSNNAHLPNGLAEDYQTECDAYDALIESLGGIDLQLLGIGDNGHIGFNEPDEQFIMTTHRVRLSNMTRRANARFFNDNPESVPQFAITMGMRHIMQAKKILLIANGAKKIAVIDRALNGPVTPRLPASLLQLHPDLTVIVSE